MYESTHYLYWIVGAISLIWLIQTIFCIKYREVISTSSFSYVFMNSFWIVLNGYFMSVDEIFYEPGVIFNIKISPFVILAYALLSSVYVISLKRKQEQAKS